MRVVNVAVANRYLTFDPFLNYKVQREIPERVFLTEEELRRLINKDFSIKRLERVRDLFVSCCFTGLSYSDLIQPGLPLRPQSPSPIVYLWK